MNNKGLVKMLRELCQRRSEGSLKVTQIELTMTGGTLSRKTQFQADYSL
jgi:hypothetical protein